MDYNHYQNTPSYPAEDEKRSPAMEISSLVLGLLAVMGCTCLYVSVVCGAMAIILALLSRGGRQTLTSKAKAGLTLGAVGLVLTVVLYATVIAVVTYTYGSIEEYLRVSFEQMGLSYEDWYNSLMGR